VLAEALRDGGRVVDDFDAGDTCVAVIFIVILSQSSSAFYTYLTSPSIS
jgi:hypothetical protein